MSKLSIENKFCDLSDYGRPIAKMIANQFKNTRVTPIHVTWMFVCSALLSVYFIIQGNYSIAGFFLILKSILDAADGELARLKKTPSYTGRYLDSVADILLNLILFLTFSFVTHTSYFYAFLAFISCSLQGTLYNYYYVILRNKTVKSDTTSRVFENKFPVALPGESQKNVNRLFVLYKILYGVFDYFIYKLEKSASKVKTMPKWFMTLVSMYGLGFQLLLMTVFLSLDLVPYINLFFIVYSFFIPLFIGLRKMAIS